MLYGEFEIELSFAFLSLLHIQLIVREGILVESKMNFL